MNVDKIDNNLKPGSHICGPMGFPPLLCVFITPIIIFFPLSNARQFYSGMNGSSPGLTNGKLNIFAVKYAYNNNLKDRFLVAVRLLLCQGASATRTTATATATATATRTSFQITILRYFNRFVTI